MLRVAGGGEEMIHYFGFLLISNDLVKFKRCINELSVKLPHFLFGNIAWPMMISV